jgi:hypothetical protein
MGGGEESRSIGTSTTVGSNDPHPSFQLIYMPSRQVGTKNGFPGESPDLSGMRDFTNFNPSPDASFDHHELSITICRGDQWSPACCGRVMPVPTENDQTILKRLPCRPDKSGLLTITISKLKLTESTP